MVGQQSNSPGTKGEETAVGNMEKNPKFTVLYEKLRGKSFEINRDAMSIGRKDSCDIQLADGSVSGHHADILRVQRDGEVTYLLRDNDSTNGTKVNNEPITEKVLKNSDLICFGHVEVLFDGASAQDEDTHYTHTIDIGNTVSNTTTTQGIGSFNARIMDEKKKSAKSNLIIQIVIGAIALVVLAVVTLTILKATRVIS